MVTGALSPVVRWFGPPALASAEATRRARALWSVAWSFLGLVAAVLIAASIATPAMAPRRAVSVGMVCVLVLLLHALNRRGRTEFASWVLVLGITTIVTQRAWHTGGVHAPVALFYVMSVLLAAGLLGARGSRLAALACMVSATVLVGAELGGRLVPPGGRGSPAEAYMAVVLALTVTLLCLTLLLRQAEDVARDDLVNMFVHDMRSPLTVVMAHLTMLREDAAGQGELAEHADAALTATMHVNGMANNLLDISRLESARLPLQRKPTDVAQVARSVAGAMGALDPTRSIEVRARMPVVCDCDADLVRRIVENLVSNAIKHSEAGGHVAVEV